MPPSLLSLHSPLSLSLSVRFLAPLHLCLSVVCFVMDMMEPDADNRCTATSSSSSPSSSSSSASEDRPDRLVKTEIEAAETLADLAQLAMREANASDSAAADGAQPAAPRFTRESPTPDSDLSHSAPPPGGQAVAGQQQDEKSATNKTVETERIQQDDYPRHMNVEQDADSLKTTSYSVVHCGKSRRNLTEEEKEARRIRRVLANRESARQTIRRRQALCEELTKKAANLMLENENLKKEREMALKEYQSLETTNKYLKAQIAKSINTEAEKTPVEQQSSAAEVTTLSGNGPWFVYNHFPVTQIFWPSIIQSSNPVPVQHTPFNSAAIPLNVSVPCSSETNSYHKQNDPVNDNLTQNPLYMVPCPWLFPLPEFRNEQPPPPSIGPIDKRAELSLGKQCSSSSSLNTVANVDYQAAALPIKLKTEVSCGWTEARSITIPGHTATRFPLDGAERKTGFHIMGNFHGPSFDCNGHASAVKHEQEVQLHSAPNTDMSLTASHIATSSLEKKQAKFMCPGKNLVDAVAAAEARKRRKELTKLRSVHNRQSRMQC